MKIIVTILIALVFTLIWLLKYEWYFNLWVVNVIWYDDTFDADLSFLKTATDYTLYMPESIYNLEKENIKSTLKFDDKTTYLMIIFTFFAIITWIVMYAIRLFPKKEDKIYLVLGVIASYYLIVEFMM